MRGSFGCKPLKKLLLPESYSKGQLLTYDNINYKVVSCDSSCSKGKFDVMVERVFSGTAFVRPESTNEIMDTVMELQVRVA